MEEITIKKGQTGNYVSVSFTGEKLAEHSPYHHDATTGTDYKLFRTKDDRFIVQIYEWSRWQGSKSGKTIEEVTKDELISDYSKLAQKGDVIEALSLDQALEQ